MDCDNCRLNSLCVTRIQLDCGKSDDAVKNISNGKEIYLKIKAGIRAVLAVNCPYYQKSYAGGYEIRRPVEKVNE